MFDILTIVNAVWFATITLLIVELLNRLPDPRSRIFLPLTCAALLGLLMGIFNPGLHAGYRGQPEYLGPFLFPVLVPLLLSGTLIFFMQRGKTALGKRAGFFGAILSSFLFLTLYQSGLYHRFLPMLPASFFLLGSALIIPCIVFFTTVRFRESLSSEHGEKYVAKDKQPGERIPRTDTRRIVSLLFCLVLVLSPLFFIDFFNNHDRATMGQLHLYLLDPARAPAGTVIHLTGEKIHEYPPLESLMKKPYLEDFPDAASIERKAVNATYLGEVFISCETESGMQSDGIVYSGESPPRYFEYDGDLYLIWILHYAGEDCVPVSLFS